MIDLLVVYQLLVDDKLLFTDENFEIMPAEGEIWPGTTASVTLIFRPTLPKHYRQVRSMHCSAPQ